MKQQIALRIEPGLLDEVRRCAADENRTVTNFIETVLKREVRRSACVGQPAGEQAEAREQPGVVHAADLRRRPSKQV